MISISRQNHDCGAALLVLKAVVLLIVRHQRGFKISIIGCEDIFLIMIDLFRTRPVSSGRLHPLTTVDLIDNPQTGLQL